jgi:hypothetical protein
MNSKLIHNSYTARRIPRRCSDLQESSAQNICARAKLEAPLSLPLEYGGPGVNNFERENMRITQLVFSTKTIPKMLFKRFLLQSALTLLSRFLFGSSNVVGQIGLNLGLRADIGILGVGSLF